MIASCSALPGSRPASAREWKPTRGGRSGGTRPTTWSGRRTGRRTRPPRARAAMDDIRRGLRKGTMAIDLIESRGCRQDVEAADHGHLVALHRFPDGMLLVLAYDGEIPTDR